MSRNARLVPLFAVVMLAAACKPSAPPPAETAAMPSPAAAAVERRACNFEPGDAHKSRSGCADAGDHPESG